MRPLRSGTPLAIVASGGRTNFFACGPTIASSALCIYGPRRLIPFRIHPPDPRVAALRMLGWWHQCRRLEIDSFTLVAANLQEFDADLAIPVRTFPFGWQLLRTACCRLVSVFCSAYRCRTPSSLAYNSCAISSALRRTAVRPGVRLPLVRPSQSQHLLPRVAFLLLFQFRVKTDFGDTRFASQSRSDTTSDHSSRIRISHLITTWAVYFLESSHPMGLGHSRCCA